MPVTPNHKPPNPPFLAAQAEFLMAMQPFHPSLWQTLGMGRSEFYRLGVGEQMRVKQEVGLF